MTPLPALLFSVQMQMRKTLFSAGGAAPPREACAMMLLERSSKRDSFAPFSFSFLLARTQAHAFLPAQTKRASSATSCRHSARCGHRQTLSLMRSRNRPHRRSLRWCSSSKRDSIAPLFSPSLSARTQAHAVLSGSCRRGPTHFAAAGASFCYFSSVALSCIGVFISFLS